MTSSALPLLALGCFLLGNLVLVLGGLLHAAHAPKECPRCERLNPAQAGQCRACGTALLLP